MCTLLFLTYVSVAELDVKCPLQSSIILAVLHSRQHSDMLIRLFPLYYVHISMTPRIKFWIIRKKENQYQLIQSPLSFPKIQWINCFLKTIFFDCLTNLLYVPLIKSRSVINDFLTWSDPDPDPNPNLFELRVPGRYIRWSWTPSLLRPL